MALLPLTMTFWDYDRVRALADGRVRIEGCDAVHFELDIHDIFFRAIRNREFDVTELSFSSYMMMVDRGDPPYVAIPVFLSRMWRYSAIYIRTDRGIEGPEDLKGREVGVPEYQVTAALAARGMLSDEYGVSASDIHWRTGGIEDPGRPEKVALDLPREIVCTPIPDDRSLSGMMVAGELDAMVSPLPPSCFTRGRRISAGCSPITAASRRRIGRRPGSTPSCMSRRSGGSLSKSIDGSPTTSLRHLKKRRRWSCRACAISAPSRPPSPGSRRRSRRRSR